MSEAGSFRMQFSPSPDIAARFGDIHPPLDQQAAAWSDLDKTIETRYYPAINTGYSNSLFTYGTKIGGFANDPNYGAPNYRDLFVKK